MATQNLDSPVAGVAGGLKMHFNFGDFVKDHVTRSWLLAGWLAILTYATVRFVLGQLAAAPITSLFILAAWLTTVGLAIYGEIFRRHSPLSFWMKNNLYNSITNVQLTLILGLALAAAVRGFFAYAVLNASFSPDPAVAQATEFSGANWGAVIDNLYNLLMFGFPRDEVWRIYAAIAMLVVLAIPSFFVYRPGYKGPKIARQGLTFLWLLTPLASYVLLRGVTPPALATGDIAIFVLTGLALAGSLLLHYLRPPAGAGRGGLLEFARAALRLVAVVGGVYTAIIALRLALGSLSLFDEINPDRAWGGLLLTIIIAVFAIVVSFPIGVLLALGRRSRIRGVPAWITYPVALVLTGLGLALSTRTSLPQAQNTLQRVLSFWPLLIPIIAFLFQRTFRGNVVAAFSTLYIEVWRGVPFITVLVMAIILFPIFLPPDQEILNTWRVLWFSAFFSAAYLAENVRGGLQAIPKGQYEAADSLGLSTYKKYRLIILPQALRIVIPAIVGQFIGLFKDTSLVAIVGLSDLLRIANSISAQRDWLGVRREPYIFIALIYFVVSAVMTNYSRRLEARLGVGER
ncbi:MAG: amino acid ABC transporter permease [Chloroflexi bacterium]|nr:amino acid ABC transporter permease [Chloroflexota bacterium]MCI0647689.1 amino acid ABC transporter permease [Chloroflexota bacterium]MCI0726582.1 amino acid ABC transporter permease [Chloroflexota bacterium]